MTLTISTKMWNVVTAIQVIQPLDAGVRKLGYCTALGGSVLHKSSSDHDLDILMMPIEDDNPNQEDLLIEFLKGLYNIKPAVGDEAKYGPSKTREVWIGKTEDGKRIDFFIYKRVF